MEYTPSTIDRKTRGPLRRAKWPEETGPAEAFRGPGAPHQSSYATGRPTVLAFLDPWFL